MANEKFKVKFGLAVGDTSATIDATTGNIVTSGDIDVQGGDIQNSTGGLTLTTASNADINLTPGGTGDVLLTADTVRVGDLNTNATITTNGTADLILNTNSGTTSGSITIADGAAGAIDISPNNNGRANLNTTVVRVGDGLTNATISSIGSTNLVLQTNDGTNSGTIKLNAVANGDIDIEPHSNGNVNLNADTVRVGDNNANATITTQGTGDLILNTNAGSNSGNITIYDGNNGNIDIFTNGNGDINLQSEAVRVGTGSSVGNISSIGAQDLLLQTNDGTNSGTITITDGANGNITIDPNGTGNINLQTATGGNSWIGAVQTNTTTSNAAGNMVRGIIRDSTTLTNGDIWSFTNGTGTGARGFSADNADNTAKAPMLVTRSFSGGAVSGNAVRGRHMVEKARGTPSAPTAVQNGDFIGTFEGTGYATDRWISDAQAFVPAFAGFVASENWANSGTTVSNCGAQFQVNLQPNATNLTTNTAAPVIAVNPQGASYRSGSLSFGRASAATFSSTGSSISGTTLTIGTLSSGSIVPGQIISGTGVTSGTYIIGNISGTGSGSTWTVSASQTVSSTTITGSSGGFTAANCTISGNVLTIGTLASGSIAVGQLVSALTVAVGTYITGNISGTGSGSTWTVSISQTVASTNIGGFDTYITATGGTGNLELQKSPVLVTNTLKNSAGLTSLTLTSGNTITTTKADSLQFQNAAGTQIGSFADNGSQTELAIIKSNATGTPISSNVATINFTTTRASGNASQNTDKLGQFKFNGSTTSGVTAQPTCSINAYAAENFTLTAQGGKVAFQANKIGTISSIDLINIDSSNLTFQTDNIEFKDSSGTLLTRDKLDYTRSYGEFAYTNAAGFDIPAQNTIYTMPLDTTLSNSGNITISGTGTINLDIAGAYKIIMSLQITLTISNQPGQIDFWLRKNGVDVANSKTQVDLLKDQKAVIAMDWLVESDGNDEFEIVYVGTSANYADIDFPTIAATTTPYVSPLAPALIVNVIPVGA